jgi:hypothetical protein
VTADSSASLRNDKQKGVQRQQQKHIQQQKQMQMQMQMQMQKTKYGDPSLRSRMTTFCGPDLILLVAA